MIEENQENQDSECLLRAHLCFQPRAIFESVHVHILHVEQRWRQDQSLKSSCNAPQGLIVLGKHCKNRPGPGDDIWTRSLPQGNLATWEQTFTRLNPVTRQQVKVAAVAQIPFWVLDALVLPGFISISTVNRLRQHSIVSESH